MSDGTGRGGYNPRFPSRRALHGTRIPQRPSDAPEVEFEAPPRRTFPSRRQIHTGQVPVTDEREASAPYEPDTPHVEPYDTGSYFYSNDPEPEIAEPATSYGSGRDSLRFSSAATSPSFSQRTIPNVPAESKRATLTTSSVSEPEMELAPNSVTPPGPSDMDVDADDTAIGVPLVEESAEETEENYESPFALPPANPFPDSAELSPTKKKTKKKKRRKTGKRVVLFFLVTFILAGIGASVWFVGNQLGLFSDNGGNEAGITEDNDFTGPGVGEATITIHSGEYGSEIGHTLVEAGVVKSVEAFVSAFNANPASGSIQPGTFTLKLEMSAAGAVAALLDEANRASNSLGIIPGETVSQVKGNMVTVAGYSGVEIDKALSDPAALGLPAVAKGEVEGWLFPGSYETPKGSTPAELLSEMIGRTVSFLKEKGIPEAEWQRILTVASIVEREVIFKTDMPKVARVIENRLGELGAETNGTLGMDSTVLYGVGKVGGMPTSTDIAFDTPYNTYMHKGLPPGPISNPSEEAIMAAMNPAEGDWLYFVTIDLESGETVFTDNYNEHEENVTKLQNWCDDHPDKCYD